MRRSSILLLAGSVLLASASAEAESRDTRERAAKKACLTGDVAKGVDILSDLYIDTNDPTYLYNQARCYEQNSRLQDAIGQFREYLRKAVNASEADRADAQKHITELEALIGKQETERAAAAEAAKEATNPAPIPPPEPRSEEPVPAALSFMRS